MSSKSTAQFKALAANRLSDGIAVWGTQAPKGFSTGFRWVEAWEDVVPASADDVDALEAWAVAEAARDEVVSERLIDVAAVEGGYQPTRMRERIVIAGPTVRRDLGKQAEHRAQAQVAQAA
ncbi:MAG: DUF2849 domain-containing protein [Pseudomonadota bacterium]